MCTCPPPKCFHTSNPTLFSVLYCKSSGNVNARIMILMSLAVIRCLHRVSVVFNLLIIHEVLVIVIMLCCCPDLMLLLLYCVKEWIQACIMCICLKKNKNPKQAAIKAASSGYRFSLARPLQNSFLFLFFFYRGRPCPCISVTSVTLAHCYRSTDVCWKSWRAKARERHKMERFIYLFACLFIFFCHWHVVWEWNMAAVAPGSGRRIVDKNGRIL